MAWRTDSDLPNRLRTYEDILTDPDTAAARQAIEKLTKNPLVTEFDLHLRVEFFRICAYLGTGRRWSERFTIDRKAAASLAQRLRADAEELRKALTSKFKFVIGSPLSADTICDIISRSAVLIEGSLIETSDRKADWTLEPKREFTQFIWRATGRPQDAQVADLITAILRLEKYTAEEQRKFRDRWCRVDGKDTMFPRLRNRTRSPQ